MPGSGLPVVRQVSAGGVVHRDVAGRIDVALVQVGPKKRWQLPKGLVDAGEKPEATAVREVREEAGVDARIVCPLDVIEYWYVGDDAERRRVRFHKFVHLFLLAYVSGDVADHDDEVDEARWVPLAEAEGMLAFESEKKAMRQVLGILS